MKLKLILNDENGTKCPSPFCIVKTKKVKSAKFQIKNLLNKFQTHVSPSFSNLSSLSCKDMADCEK